MLRGVLKPDIPAHAAILAQFDGGCGLVRSSKHSFAIEVAAAVMPCRAWWRCGCACHGRVNRKILHA